MTFLPWMIILVIMLALLLVPQLVRLLGRVRGLLATLCVLVAFAGGWWLLGRASPHEAVPADWAAVTSVPSATCATCHPSQYESWHRTFHRTMTRDASPADVKGDFNNVIHQHQGLTTRLLRHENAFFMETVDPAWAMQHARGAKAGPQRSAVFSVDRVVGSHWIQEYMHREPSGRFQRLPMLYHIVENRWVPSNGAFLAPDTDDFWAQCRGSAWNDSCLYCHNTGPHRNPVRDKHGTIVGYETQVAELGISCEACHGPGGDHVRWNRNPARRFALQQASSGDPSIVHPARLSVPRRDDICARCHGAITPKRQAWDLQTGRDPFIPGQDLTRFNHFFWSEAEQLRLATGREPVKSATVPIDGRFWDDGTPLTTALEYNGMALSACYENGRGRLSCLSCHTMHGDDPNFLLKPGMLTNEACYQCHEDYRARLTQHTRHPKTSPGSLCYNCHMPHLVYSLLTTHRSHRIETPNVEVSRRTGKPHACNLCHLDKSLGWTQDQLAHWSMKATPLPADEQRVSSALLLLTQGDARSRVMVAGAFSQPGAIQAAGSDWFAPFLTRLLEHERYPAIRYLAHRGLRVAHGETAVSSYDYLATPEQRRTQLRQLRTRLDQPLRRPLPHLPLTRAGRPDESVLREMLKKRHDPDLYIHE